MSALTTRVCRLYAQGDVRVETESVAAPGPGEALLAGGAGGICGSDLHYFQHGGFGPIRVREPIILGHEAAGTVIAVGDGVEGLAVGQRVAINPSRPCMTCTYCLRGMTTHCLYMRFSGSAMRLPHEQGMFRDRIVVPATQCVPLGDDVSISEGACSEPLAVCLHARSMAGDVAGKRVIVTGAGPIGALCVAAAFEAGAAEIVVTDMQDAVLAVAAQMGATKTINIVENGDALDAYRADKGAFDIAFECSGAAPAVRTALEVVRPQGTIVQVGIAGDMPIPVNLLVSKEIRWQGTQRFAAEFAEAVDKISTRRIDVRPIITASVPLADAADAFALAGDRTRAVKVHFQFAD